MNLSFLWKYSVIVDWPIHAFWKWTLSIVVVVNWIAMWGYFIKSES